MSYLFRHVTIQWVHFGDSHLWCNGCVGSRRHCFRSHSTSGISVDISLRFTS